MAWQIRLEPEVKQWLHAMRTDDPATLKAISAAIDNLVDGGPALGRPLVDKIQHVATVHKLKELRPASAGSSEVRILFAFDEKRQAIFLVGGNKEGDWEEWYDEAIPLAEERFEAHQHRLAEQDKQAAKPKRKK